MQTIPIDSCSQRKLGSFAPIGEVLLSCSLGSVTFNSIGDCPRDVEKEESHDFLPRIAAARIAALRCAALRFAFKLHVRSLSSPCYSFDPDAQVNLDLLCPARSRP